MKHTNLTHWKGSVEQKKKAKGEGMRRRGVQALWGRGFTLVELMIVVTIISILAAVATPSLTRSMRRAESREAAGRLAQVFRTARTQAMGRGEIVLLRLDRGNDANFVTMSAAPNSVIGNPNSPVLRSCRLLVNFGQGLLFPHPDTTGTPIAPLTRSKDSILGPNVVLFNDGVAGATRDLCFAPDGRVYDGVTALPVDYGLCADRDRGFVLVLGRDTGAGVLDATNLSEPTTGGTRDVICQGGVESSVARDVAYAHVIEVTHNGAVTVE